MENPRGSAGDLQKTVVSIAVMLEVYKLKLCHPSSAGRRSTTGNRHLHTRRSLLLCRPWRRRHRPHLRHCHRCFLLRQTSTNSLHYRCRCRRHACCCCCCCLCPASRHLEKIHFRAGVAGRIDRGAHRQTMAASGPTKHTQAADEKKRVEIDQRQALRLACITPLHGTGKRWCGRGSKKAPSVIMVASVRRAWHTTRPEQGPGRNGSLAQLHWLLNSPQCRLPRM